MQLQMGQVRVPAGSASAPHQPWQMLMQQGQLQASPQGVPRPGAVMYSGPMGGPAQSSGQPAAQLPVSIRLSNYSGQHQCCLTLKRKAAPCMLHTILSPADARHIFYETSTTYTIVFAVHDVCKHTSLAEQACSMGLHPAQMELYV